MDALEEIDSIQPQHVNIFGKSDDAYRLLLDTLSAGIVVIDGKGKVLFANNAFTRNLHFTLDEVENKKNIADFIGRDDLEKVVHLHESMKENPSNSPRMSEIRIVDRYGEVHKSVITAALIPRTENLMITGLDLANSPATKDEGPFPEELFRRIFDISGIGAIILEDNTGIALANATFCQLVGYAREELEGRFGLSDIVCEEDMEMVLEYHRTRRIEQRPRRSMNCD
jgi:PAS domain S-box-containing protein